MGVSSLADNQTAWARALIFCLSRLFFWCNFKAMAEKTNRFMVWMALGLCLMILAKFILFKNTTSYYKRYFRDQYHSGVIRQGWKRANLTPFATIRHFFKSKRLRTEYKVDNIGGNILGFMPLGFLIGYIRVNRQKILAMLLCVLGISLFFEVTQLLTGLGAMDIDDIILNVLGGLLGFLFYRVSRPQDLTEGQGGTG